MKTRDPQRPSSSELFSVISGRLLPDDTPDHELMSVDVEEDDCRCRVIPFPLSRVRRSGRGTPPPPPPRTVA
jgi:hypothetical protein